MNLPKFSVEHSLFANLLSVMVLVSGLLLLFFNKLPREAFPNVDYGFVTVQTTYGGATSKEIEKLITIPIEDELREVDGIEELTSISLEAFSMIFIQMDPDVENSDKVVNDIQRAVDRVPDLPDESEDPIVAEIRTEDQPVLIVSLSGEDIWTLRQTARSLEDWIEEMKGVARVDKSGWRETEIWVSVDPEKLEAYHLALEEVARALRSRNTNVPGGKLYIDGEQHVIRTLGEFETPEEIENVIIRANDQGNWLSVGDVAEVDYALEENDKIEKTNGHMAVNLVVAKKAREDTLNLVRDVRERIEAFRPQLPDDVNLHVMEDLALKYVRRRLRILTFNGTVGVLLVALVLLLFLTPRTAFLTALGIPLSFGAALIVMWMMGITINLLTMFGLVIVLGLVVDDAIVVAENSYRYLEQGMPAHEAAIKGAQEVVKPVTATILTSVAAFLPLAFMSGIIGKFMAVFPVVVIATLVASLLECLFILPSHFADFVTPKTSRIQEWAGGWFEKARMGYLRILEGALKVRWFFLIGVFAIMAGSLILAATKMRFVLFPARGVETFFVRVEAPSGTSLDQVNKIIEPIEKEIEKLPEKELDYFLTTVGLQQEEAGDPATRRGTNLGQIQVYLQSDGRDREAQEIMDEIQAAIEVPDEVEISFEEIRTGPPVGKPVDVQIRGKDFAQLEAIAAEYKEYLSGIEGVKDIRDDYESGKPEFRVMVDEQAARRAKVGFADVGRTVRYAFAGGRATSIKTTEEEVDVLVRLPESARHNLSTLDALVVENTQGDLVPLRRIATFEQAPGVSMIKHIDYQRAISVSARIDEKVTTSVEVNRRLQKDFADISKRHPGYTVRYAGEDEDTKESMAGLFIAFGLAALAIYSILAVALNSLVHPITVMIAIPFGLIGVILAFYFHNLELSFMAMLGVVGLSGVVVNDSIVLVDFIDRYSRRRGESRLKGIIEAAQHRFRPVLLTTATTAVGLAPVAYGIGGLDPFLMPAAMALTWGLIFATVLTLVFIPCLYAIELDVKNLLLRLLGRPPRPLA